MKRAAIFNGSLSLGRGNSNLTPCYCPFRSDSASATPCGTWCPLFDYGPNFAATNMDPYKQEQKGWLITLCRNSIVVDELLDSFNRPITYYPDSGFNL